MQVLLVTGGHAAGIMAPPLATTELLVQGAAAWTFAASLPSAATDGIRGVSIGNSVIVAGSVQGRGESIMDTVTSGGYNGGDLSSVLQFDPSTQEWRQVGELQQRRYSHAMSVVTVLDIMDICHQLD